MPALTLVRPPRPLMVPASVAMLPLVYEGAATRVQR